MFKLCCQKIVLKRPKCPYLKTVFSVGAVAGPMRHPTGLPKTHGASVLSKRCLNLCLEDGPRLSSQRSIPLSLTTGWPPPRCALGQPAVFSTCGHGHWRILPGSAGPVLENWNRVSCSAASLGDASIFLKEIASVYFRPLRGVGRDAAAPFIVYESIGFCSWNTHSLCCSRVTRMRITLILRVTKLEKVFNKTC